MQLTLENDEEVRDFCGGCWYGGKAYHYSGRPERFSTELAVNVSHTDEGGQRYLLVMEGAIR